MYDSEDVNMLTERFVDAINLRNNIKENSGFNGSGGLSQPKVN
jgi:hypothetical protein